jgi:hypothetical protein
MQIMRKFSFPSHKCLIASEPVISRYFDSYMQWVPPFTENTIAMNGARSLLSLWRGAYLFWTAGISPFVSKTCFVMSSVTSGTQKCWLQSLESQWKYQQAENSKYRLRKWLLWALFLLIHVFLILLINKRWKHLHSSHKTGLAVRCHFDASPKRQRWWRHKKAFRNCWLAASIAQLWRHLLFLYILKDVCEEQGNWISTFLIELFLIHGGATTGKITILR